MRFAASHAYTGTSEQDEVLRNQCERRFQFRRERKVPVCALHKLAERLDFSHDSISTDQSQIWNGEFGPVAVQKRTTSSKQTSIIAACFADSHPFTKTTFLFWENLVL